MEANIDADILRIPVGPGAMHVERFGHGGRPVVLVHGFPTSSFLWRNVAPMLAVENYTAYAVDLFGYGESDRPFDADFGIAAQAEYLDRALTALRLRTASIVGVDMGGTIALRLAVTRPERVERLVVVNPPALDELPGRDIRQLLARSPRWFFHAFMRLLRASRGGVLPAAPVVEPILRQSVADPDHMPPRLVARYLAPFVGRDGLAQLFTLARAVRAQDLHEEDLRSVRVPTLIVWGDCDDWLDDRLAERLQATIPGSRLHHLRDVARLVPEEAPEELARLVLAFITASGEAAPVV